MATGNYGTIRPSDVSPEDVEIVVVYTESRDDTQNFTLTTLNAQDVLRPYFNNANTGGSSVEICPPGQQVSGPVCAKHIWVREAENKQKKKQRSKGRSVVCG